MRRRYHVTVLTQVQLRVLFTGRDSESFQQQIEV